MKKCPQCNSVFGDDLIYCSNDGEVLVEENLSLPSEFDDGETDTIIRRDPIVVNFGESAKPTEAFENIQHIPQTQPIIIEQKSVSRNYAIFLILGLLIGGVLVLATLLAAKYIYRPNETQTDVQNSANENQNTEIKGRGNEVNTLADNLHQKKVESKPDEDFNGRVIVVNAYVRSAPDLSAKQIDILPIDDRITIERRENPNSPWYYVICEHGTSGWMHGNTIEFTN
jgi:hypothetical protein